MTFTAIDCQSFAGGFSYGVVSTGFKLIAKREHEGGYGVPAMEANRHLLGYDWEVQAGPASSWTPMKADLLFGNPPCSGFSNMSSSYSPEFKASKNACMVDLIDYAAKCDPQIVIFESVQEAYRNASSFLRSLRSRLETATGHKWTLYHALHNVSHLGGAQERKRYFFVASRIPFGVRPLERKDPITVLDRIGDLVDVPLGSIEGHEVTRQPRAKRLAQLAETGEWKPGWKAALAHQRAPFVKVDGIDTRITGFCAVRLKGDAPSRVLKGDAPLSYIHPIANRTLTWRELVRLSGFSDDWVTAPYAAKTANMKWIGKGICVEAAQWIAESARAALAGEPYDYQGELIGPGEYLIDTKTMLKDPEPSLFDEVML